MFLHFLPAFVNSVLVHLAEIVAICFFDDSWGKGRLFGLVIEGQFNKSGDEESLGCVWLIGERVCDCEESDEGDAEDTVGTGFSCAFHQEHGDEESEEDGDDVEVEAIEAVDYLIIVVEFAFLGKELAVS
jgi:hypothetical protein